MKNVAKKPATKGPSKSRAPRGTKCGICGENKPSVSLVKTKCCDKWIHNDLTKYRPFSFYSSCYRNHERYTMCGFHYTESHSGKWKKCSECTKDMSCHEEMFDFPDTDDEIEANTSKKAASKPKPSPKPKAVSKKAEKKPEAKPAKRALTRADAVSKTKHAKTSTKSESSLVATTSIMTRSLTAMK